MQLSQLFAYLLRNVDILPTHPKFFYKQRRAKPKSIWQHRYMYAMHIIVERVSSTPYFQVRFSGQIDIHTFHTESRFQSTEKPNSDKPLPKPLIIQQWTSYWIYLKITETLKSTSLWSSLCLALPIHLKSHRWSTSDPNCTDRYERCWGALSLSTNGSSAPIIVVRFVSANNWYKFCGNLVIGRDPRMLNNIRSGSLPVGLLTKTHLMINFNDQIYYCKTSLKLRKIHYFRIVIFLRVYFH